MNPQDTPASHPASSSADDKISTLQNELSNAQRDIGVLKSQMAMLLTNLDFLSRCNLMYYHDIQRLYMQNTIIWDLLAQATMPVPNRQVGQPPVLFQAQKRPQAAPATAQVPLSMPASPLAKVTLLSVAKNPPQPVVTPKIVLPQPKSVNQPSVPIFRTLDSHLLPKGPSK